MRGPVSGADIGVRQLIAEKFVSVQVDPFKRPDIAQRYDSGGWPALVVALPDGRVFARAGGYCAGQRRALFASLAHGLRAKARSTRCQGAARHPSKG